MKAGAADESAGLGDRHRIAAAAEPSLRGHFDEGSRFGLAIGMGHARQHLGDAAAVGEPRYVGNVLGMRRPQHQPFRHENGAFDPQALAFDLFLLCNHFIVLQAKKKGSWRPISPVPFPGFSRHRTRDGAPVFGVAEPATPLPP